MRLQPRRNGPKNRNPPGEIEELPQSRKGRKRTRSKTGFSPITHSPLRLFASFGASAVVFELLYPTDGTGKKFLKYSNDFSGNPYFGGKKFVTHHPGKSST